MARPLWSDGTNTEDAIMKRSFISGVLKFAMLTGMALSVITCKKNDSITTSLAPSAITNSAGWPGRNWAILKGQVNAKDKLTTVSFQYGTSKDYTNSVSPDPDTTSGTANINFSIILTGLKAGTEYHYRINAVNASGVGNGADVAFYTTDSAGIAIDFNPDLTYDSIYDQEGNKYRTIAIGTQIWTAENLKSTKLNDGTEIPFVPDVTKWADLTSPGYCWYNNDSVGYGAIYNWYTVNTGKLCPEGWHVPGDDEWTVLTDFLGGKNVAGGSMKETGNSHWLTPNTGATNASGFTGLPSGYRNYAGGFNNIGKYAFWWSSTEWSSAGSWYRDVYYGYESVDRSNSSMNSGATVRCIKD